MVHPCVHLLPFVLQIAMFCSYYTWNFWVSKSVSIPGCAYALRVSHQSDLNALKDAGSHPSTEGCVHSPRFFLETLSVGSMNSRYSNQSRYEHMPYMCRMSGTFSQADAPYES